MQQAVRNEKKDIFLCICDLRFESLVDVGSRPPFLQNLGTQMHKLLWEKGKMCICVFVYLCICVFVYLCICVFVYLCICVFVYVCMCVCVYVCMCVFVISDLEFPECFSVGDMFCSKLGLNSEFGMPMHMTTYFLLHPHLIIEYVDFIRWN